MTRAGMDGDFTVKTMLYTGGVVKMERRLQKL